MTPKELESVKWAMAIIRDKIESGFYGEVTFKYQDGKPVLCEVKEQVKPPKV